MKRLGASTMRFSLLRRISRLNGMIRPYRALSHVSTAITTEHRDALSVHRGSAGRDRIQLRDYQEECIGAVLSSLSQGHKRVGVSLATGGGKTVIFTQLIDRVQPANTLATQTLILAHRRELVEQAARHCSSAYPDKTIDIEMGKLHSSGLADITIASVQSIGSGDRLAKFDPARFKLVLVDEVHHAVAPSFFRVLDHFGLAKKQTNSPHLVGVSATFSRFDGLRLGAVIDEIVYHKDYVDMIGEKWLSDVVFTTVTSPADLSRVGSRVAKGALQDFNIVELSRAVNTAEVNEVTVRTWLGKASGRKSTLVFCVDIDHVIGLTQTFQRYGIDARFVTGNTRSRERAANLDAFRKGEYPVLLNCGVFTEGTDIPNVDCILLARPTKSRNLLVQMIGRGMRLSPGKTNCHVIDLVSSLETGITTTPTLFGLDPTEVLNEASLDRILELRDHKNVNDAARSGIAASGEASADIGQMSLSFTDYDSVLDLISDTSGDRHIRALSQFSWVGVGSDRYILSGPTGTYLRIERADEDGTMRDVVTYKVWEVRKLPAGSSKSPFAAPRELLKAITLADAVHGADKYASEAFPYMFISRHAGWRNGPATEGQLEFLNKMRDKQDQLTEKDITKGKAADMLTRIKHGARGRFTGLEADRKRHARIGRKAALQQEQKLRETVSVGPLPL